MSKKKIILTIAGFAIILLLTMYITSIATAFAVGQSVQLGMGYPGSTLEDSNGNKVDDSKNLMTSTNFDYFCAHRGVSFGTAGRAITFYNIANVEITGDTAKLTAGKEYKEMSTELYEETYVETETSSNKALALLFYEIKDGEVTIGGETVTRARDNGKTEGLNYGFVYDFGQSAMWRVLKDWQANVASKMDTSEESLWGKVESFIQTEDLENTTDEDSKNYDVITEAYNNGQKLYEDVTNRANNMTVENEYGIEETLYNNPSPEKEVQTRIDDGNYTILGPFKYNFSGPIKNGKPTLTFDSDATAKTYAIGTYIGSTFTESEMVSGNEFYIKVENALLQGTTKIHFNFQIEGISLYNTKTTIYFFERDVNFESYQPIIHIEQTEGYNKPYQDSYTISKPVDIELEKLDASGNALKAEGIKFQIKDETNAVVGYFKTDANGNGIVVDVNGNPTGKTAIKILTNQTYTLVETENNAYGYKNYSLSKDDIEISGAEIEQSGKNIKFTLDNKCADKVAIKAKNIQELGKLTIHKLGKDNKNLSGVEFAIWQEVSEGKGYLKLDTVTEPLETADSGLDITKYNVTYVSSVEEATKFKTNSSGKIVINNLEIYSGISTKYKYWTCEISNDNYGYKGMVMNDLDVTVTGGEKLEIRTATKEIKHTIETETTVTIKNTPYLGDLQLAKVDQDNNNIRLPNVGFKITIDGSKYLQLVKAGGPVERVKGTAVIDEENYYLQYVEDSSKATEFVTDEQGNLEIRNLEVYSGKGTNNVPTKYTYKLIETSNSNYGYVVDSVELGNVTLEPNEDTNKQLTNLQVYTKISGYVWIENSAGKANGYDGVYTQGTESSDVKLTDLYIMHNGTLTKNESAAIKVEIKLRDRETGEFIKELPDEFDESGRYTFIDVETSKLSNYEVVFVYNGFYYTTITENLNEANGSKVKEVASERTNLNNKFTTIQDNSQVVSNDGTVNTVEYNKDGHTSTVSKLNFDTTVSANTAEANYNLREKYNDLKAEQTETLEGIDNINMGIVLREQPKISINNDIYSVLVDFEGYKYNYKYNGRQNFYENKNGDDIGVKFEQDYTAQRYTRTVYASDIQAAKDLNKEIKVSITYKMQIANQSTTLSVMPKQIINYFDYRYTVQAVGLGLDETNHTITNTLAYSEPRQVEGHSEYKSTIIDFSQLIKAGKENVKDLYITFDVSREAILDLLNDKSTYHNASEILSYASYYGETTSEVANISDKTSAGSIYAGIDKMSQPGNMEIALVNHPSVEGTQILDVTNFEDDTSSAPSLLLEAAESRRISGTIWEDTVTNTTNNQKLGNGIFEQGEKPIQNVKVELCKVDENGNVGEIAKYSNDTQVTAITDENGNYTFGYYDEEAKKQVGVLPGRYVIKYTYNNESYIVGNRNINVDIYKSTIVTSETIKNAFNGQNERWFTVKEDNRYSDARDNIVLRPEYNPSVDINMTVTNSTYSNTLSIETMEAHTPIMDIGIEFTAADAADMLTLELVKELKNVDFGIVERPDVDITVEKQITGLEIVAQNGTSVIPKGNPLETKMQYVKALDGLVSVEIESKLLQGAKLNLEYTVSVHNNSDLDYLEEEYYYYGTGGKTEKVPTVLNLVDYLDNTMSLDPEQSQDIWQEKDVEYLKENGLISEDVYNKLKESGNCNILITEEFKDVGSKQNKSVKMYTTRYLAVSDSIAETNSIEAIQLSGKRTIKETIPGDYEPSSSSPTEQDEDKIEFIITPPTGTTVNYTLYAIAIVATLTILVVGIVIIKKKLIK